MTNDENQNHPNDVSKPESSRSSSAEETAKGPEPERGDRWIILAQLVIGALLVMFGALLGVIFTRSTALATAVIGAGAALLPAGAAASATARMNQRAASRRSTTHKTQ